MEAGEGKEEGAHGESGSPLKHSDTTDSRAIERKTQTGQRQMLPPSLVHPLTPLPPFKRRREKENTLTLAGESRAGLISTNAARAANMLVRNGCSLLQKRKLCESAAQAGRLGTRTLHR